MSVDWALVYQIAIEKLYRRFWFLQVLMITRFDLSWNMVTDVSIVESSTCFKILHTNFTQEPNFALFCPTGKMHLKKTCKLLQEKLFFLFPK
jgi:hypothetical protein